MISYAFVELTNKTNKIVPASEYDVLGHYSSSLIAALYKINKLFFL